MSDAPAAPRRKGREWSPRIWEGFDFFAWWRLLHRNRYAVPPTHWHLALIISNGSFFNSVMGAIERGRTGDAVRRTRVQHPPVFILGHWRSGTTLLHELLIRDPRHNYPTTYQCISPNHFLLSEGFFRRYMNWLVPGSRPMDNMAAGLDRPQEDEFALCMLGQHSPYLTVAFPNRPPLDRDWLTLENVSDADRRAWRKALFGFVQRLTYRDPRRLILKSPPHTARIPTLLEIFPDARFVHITRDPYVLYPSTVNLWRSLYRKHGMQRPDYRGLDERVTEDFLQMYDAYERGKKLVPAGRLAECRYEDLVRDPLGEMTRLYAELDLGDFAPARPRVEAYLASTAGYETNKYGLTPEREAEVTRRWGPVIERLGYPLRVPLQSPRAGLQSP